MSISDRCLALAIPAFCLFQCMGLVVSWTEDSAESLTWVVFVVWCIPICFFGWGRPVCHRKRLWIAALSCVVIGELMSLHTFHYLGFVIALVSRGAGWIGQRFWAASSLMWMPVTGWFCTSFFGSSWLSLRAILVFTTVAYSLAVANRSQIRRCFDFSFLRTAMRGFGVSAVLACPFSVSADTFTYSPVQATARPMGLDVVDFVGLAGSDAASADFLANELPGMQELIDTNLGERNAIDGSGMGGLISLDPSKLDLAVASDVRAYFVGEGAGYHNSFGFNTSGGGVESGDPLLIFPDASSPNSYLSSGGGERTLSEPLMPGDFVELGSLEAGTSLDFFLIANGARGGRNVFSTDGSINPDGISHVVTFSDVENPYLLIGFEDLFGGGDEDFNDLLIALYIGEENTASLIESASWGSSIPAPEPESMALIAVVLGVLLRRRRRDEEKFFR